MRNVFPKVTFKDGKYVATMLDKFGHQWATGEGDTRVAAIYDVRHKTPPASFIRAISSWAVHHPVITSVAVAAGQWAFASSTRRVTVGGLILVAVATYFALKGIKRAFFHESAQPETI